MQKACLAQDGPGDWVDHLERGLLRSMLGEAVGVV